MKDVIKVAFVDAIAVVCGTSFLNSQKSDALSEVALANVEALADKKPGYDLGCFWGIEIPLK